MVDNRVRFLVMRCVSCKNFLTSLEMIRRWEAMEKDETRKIGLCECGARQFRPGNLTSEEEKQYSSWWQWFRYMVLRRQDKGTRIWELYYKVVRKGELGPEYQGGR